MRLFLLSIIFTCSFAVEGNSKKSTAEDTGKIQISAYADMYYLYDFTEPFTGWRQYAFFASRHNSPSVNLAFIRFAANTSQTRFVFTPAIGTYMERNYAGEPTFWRYVYECSAGFKPGKKGNWWLDAGVFGSPYTNENAESIDMISYTRSLGSENSPYYLSGIRSTHKLKERWQITGYLLNGWQQIRSSAKRPALGLSTEYKPDKNKVVVFSAFAGYPGNSLPFITYYNRYFADIHADFGLDKRFRHGFCITGGVQQKKIEMQGKWQNRDHYWGSASYQVQQKLGRRQSIAGRIEAYFDPEATIVQPIPGAGSYTVASASATWSLNLAENFIFRVEGRVFSGDNLYYQARWSSPNSIIPIRESGFVVASVAGRW